MSPIEWHRKRRDEGMSQTAEIILSLVNEKVSLRVTDVMGFAQKEKVASAATLHGAIMWLRENGYTQVETENDGRVKTVFMTTKGKKYLGVKK